jgi:hypothetical protein
LLTGIFWAISLPIGLVAQISIAAATPACYEEIRVIEFRHNLGCRGEIVFTGHLDKHLSWVVCRID